MLPVYVETSDNDCADAWLERDRQRFPLKRALDEVEPVILSGAPTTGAEARAARQLVERCEDVRVAGALLQAAAEHLDLAIDTTRYIKFVPFGAQREWVRPLIAAREPLRRIIEACAALEDALAGAGETSELHGAASGGVDLRKESQPVTLSDPPVDPTVAAGEAVRATLPDKRTRETIALVARTIAAVSPVMEAVERLGPAAGIGMPTLPSLPTLPALPSVAIGPRPLTLDELHELERVGLGMPSFPAIP